MNAISLIAALSYGEDLSVASMPLNFAAFASVSMLAAKPDGKSKSRVFAQALSGSAAHVARHRHGALSVRQELATY